MRKFEEVKKDCLKFPLIETQKPIRADKGSAGYDFFSKEDYVLKNGESHVFWTDICVVLPEDNVLLIDTRSGNGVKKGIVLKNTIGVIDCSYINATNGGNIGICLQNNGEEDFIINVGDRIAQGIITNCYFVEDDTVLNNERNGGFGHSGK